MKPRALRRPARAHAPVTLLAATLLGALPLQGLPAQTVGQYSCAGDSSWTAPQSPVRIHGTTWHVGPRGLGVFLITSPTGHVLIDGGPPGGAAMIEANVRRAGFDPRDIKWILVSHAHCDHAGDVAALARSTGAQIIAGPGDEPLLARGGRDDPQYRDRFTFAPTRATRSVTDGERLRLGDLVLTAHHTPGHTKGNLTWSWESCEGGRCLTIVDIASLSAPGYRLVGDSTHRQLVADYERSFTKVEALRCDIALSPHPELVDFWGRVAKRDAGDPGALVDASRCRTYANGARARFRTELARQRGGG